MPKLLIKYSDETEPEYDDYFNEDDIGFRTKNSEYIKTIFTFFSTIVTEMNIRVTPEGVYICAMDMGHISLIDSFIPKNLFSTYQCDKEYVVGINLNIMVRVLNHLKMEDELIFIFGKEGEISDSIELVYVNHKYDKFYEFKLINIDNEEYDVHEFDDTAKITMSSRYFNDIIKDFQDIGENLRIKILKDKEKISLKTDGEMTNLKMVLNNEELIFENLKDICLEFNLKNISMFSKGYQLHPEIKIEINNDVPVKMRYKIGDGYIDYYLAPKMED
tara:strand:+ start:3957 stop:4781 length:825 start_codon:yes stop_codon:yes gene_type:complete